jgi:hypothetical protein
MIWLKGYLFYGNPGNGKTAVIRIMASHPHVRPYTLDLSNMEEKSVDASGLRARIPRRIEGLLVSQGTYRTSLHSLSEELTANIGRLAFMLTGKEPSRVGCPHLAGRAALVTRTGWCLLSGDDS